MGNLAFGSLPLQNESSRCACNDKPAFTKGRTHMVVFSLAFSTLVDGGSTSLQEKLGWWFC